LQNNTDDLEYFKERRMLEEAKMSLDQIKSPTKLRELDMET
jgi:hypothetical protein